MMKVLTRLIPVTFWLLLAVLIIAAVLRLYGIAAAPLGLFGDEIDAGYNAYSLLKTGRDYNGNFLPIHFESMGDYRPFLFIWSLVPSLAIFGLSEFSVRLIPAIWGIVGVLFIYLLVRELFKEKLTPTLSLSKRGSTNPLFQKEGEVGINGTITLALLAAFLLAIIPWHIHYSRAAFEVTLMLALLLIGVWSFVKAVQNGKVSWLCLSGCIFALNSYSYNIAKLYSPLLLILCLTIYRKWLFKRFKFSHLVLAGGLWLTLMLPLISDSTIGLGQQRFQNLNILHTPDLVSEINYQRGQISTWPVWLRKVFHNKANSLTAIFIDNYLQTYSPQFLFSVGQVENPRHSLPGQGLLYWWMAPFVIHGLYAIWQTRTLASSQLLFVWLATAPLPAALTIDGGQHATRLAVMIPPLVILTTIGIQQIFTLFKAPLKIYFGAGLGLIIIISLTSYLQRYYFHYTPTYHRWWNYGMEPALSFAKAHENEYDRIIITKGFVHLPMLYYLFYNQYPPDQLHQQFALREQNLAPDPTSQIGKYYFSSIPTGDTYNGPKALYIGLPSDMTQQWRGIGQVAAPDPMDTNPVLVFMESL